ncbi:MAG: exopolysaccharide biosynthesis protein [Candidatus Aminicenantes bacterium]|nr:exopolysaccharide biosynthesis protein [Candidatus Aminicenantes bacterium]
MIDLHCHILPGIDDGPSDIETSIRMSKIAADDGITHIVATPHFKYNEKPTIDDIKDRLKMLEERVNKENIRVKFSSGADIGLTYELTYGIDKNEIPTINGSRYFLLELPNIIPPNLDNFLFTAELKGFVPIITHPERNYSLLSFPEKMEALRDSGALFQLTAMSITGEFGTPIKKFSQMLLKKGFIDFVASDAHSAGWRNPVLSSAYWEITELFDEDEAQRIFLKNPLAVVENREISKKKKVRSKE